jgi:quercetin dioxygenase-like cupin family protein
VVSGSFLVEVDDRQQVLSAGDGFYIPPGAVHGVKCLEAGVLLDAFSPCREDFL